MGRNKLHDDGGLPSLPGVYQIKCAATGEIYIGSSVDMARRWRRHQQALKAESHPNAALQMAWGSYGWEGFTVSVLDQTDDYPAVEKQRIRELCPRLNCVLTENPECPPKPRGITHNGGRKPKPPGDKARSFSLTLSAAEHRRVSAAAARDGMTIQQWIISLVAQAK